MPAPRTFLFSALRLSIVLGCCAWLDHYIPVALLFWSQAAPVSDYALMIWKAVAPPHSGADAFRMAYLSVWASGGIIGALWGYGVLRLVLPARARRITR